MQEMHMMGIYEARVQGQVVTDSKHHTCMFFKVCYRNENFKYGIGV